MVALFERIVSDREGAELAARLGEAYVLDGDEDGIADRLLAEIERSGATLAVVGCRGLSRPQGIASGSAPTTVVHEAPCSVLVARGTGAAESWPRTIVAGLDGTPESERAVSVARLLAARLGSRLYVVTATRADPVSVLADEAENADLLVVGSRGLRGVRALASVSERVAHEARCPVLVVKE